MYGVLVCEDEDIIRRKIIRAIDWKANGFEPVLEAKTGAEAVELFDGNDVQILVSDIRMPGMDGLQLIERAKRRNPQLKSVVISGYSEFDYARTAIRLNVYDYILKPFRSRKLLAVLLELRGILDEERARADDITELRERLSKSSMILQDRIIADLIDRPAGTDLKVASIYVEGTSLEEQPVYVAVLADEQIPAPPSGDRAAAVEGPRDSSEALATAVREEIAERGLAWRAVRCGRDCVALVIPGLPEHSQGELERLHDRLNCGASGVTLGVGRAYPGLKNGWRSFQEAREAVGQSFFRGAGRVYSFKEIEQRSVSLTEIARVMRGHHIFDELRSGAFHELEHEIAEIFEEVERSSLEASAVGSIVAGLILTACLALDEAGEDFTAIFGDGFDPLAQAREAASLTQARDRLIQFFEAIRLDVRRQQSGRNQKLIGEIRDFVSSHFPENITLQGLALRFNISPSYVSLLFKSSLGCTFSEYLSDLRIRRAKELLTYSDLRIYEIAEAVGYRDPYYFSASFKHLTGRSPSEYRSGDP